jgi:hypothetical protein
MLRRRKSPPSYPLYRPTGQAIVTSNGQDHYLGRHGTKESKDAYDRLIGEWISGGRVLSTPSASPNPAVRDVKPAHTPAAPAGQKVKAVLLAYMEHAARYYRGPDGQLTAELDNMAAALGPVRSHYDDTPVAAFGPLRASAGQ